MGTIKRENAEIKRGILNNGSGGIQPIVLQKNGVIRIRRQIIKRRNQNKP